MIHADPANLAAAADITASDLLADRLRRVREPWMADAACVGSDVNFFAAATKVAPALQVCGRCPVMLQCRAWACDPENLLSEGVAGGMTAAARRLVVRRRSGRKAQRARAGRRP